MKIAISCDEYCARIGDNYYLRNFGQILVNRYLMVFENVRFIVRTFECSDLDKCGKFNIIVDNPRIEVYPIPFFQGPKEFLKHKFKINYAIKNALIGCDIAIFRLPSAIGFSVLKQALRRKIPYAVELVYDCKDGFIQANGINKVLWWKMHREQIYACKKAIGIAPVTSHYLQSHYIPKNNSIVQSHYSSVELNPNFFYQPRKFPNKEFFTLVHVANQVEFKGRKGHEDVVLTVSNLIKRGINVKAIFVGEDYRDGIRQLKQYAESLDISREIDFTGFLNPVDMRRILLESDIAILPTRAEGLPRVIIEAMALGLPCITTNVSGNPELIDKEFLFDYGDVSTIADIVESLVYNKEKYETASLINYNRSLEFSKEVLDKRRVTFYSEIRNLIDNNNNVSI